MNDLYPYVVKNTGKFVEMEGEPVARFRTEQDALEYVNGQALKGNSLGVFLDGVRIDEY